MGKRVRRISCIFEKKRRAKNLPRPVQRQGGYWDLLFLQRDHDSGDWELLFLQCDRGVMRD
jgi:hypothetical protein